MDPDIPDHLADDGKVDARDAHEEQQRDENVVERRAERVAHRAQRVPRQETAARDQEVSVGAQVAELGSAIEVPEFRRVGDIGTEGEGALAGREFRRVAGAERV